MIVLGVFIPIKFLLRIFVVMVQGLSLQFLAQYIGAGRLVDDANIMPVGVKIKYGLVLSKDWLGRVMGKLSLMVGVLSKEMVSLKAMFRVMFLR